MLLKYKENGKVKEIEVEDIDDLIDEFGIESVIGVLVELHAQSDDDLFDILLHITGDAWED